LDGIVKSFYNRNVNYILPVFSTDNTTEAYSGKKDQSYGNNFAGQNILNSKTDVDRCSTYEISGSNGSVCCDVMPCSVLQLPASWKCLLPPYSGKKKKMEAAVSSRILVTVYQHHIPEDSNLHVSAGFLGLFKGFTIRICMGAGSNSQITNAQ
jgi:hypothetical protein